MDNQPESTSNQPAQPATADQAPADQATADRPKESPEVFRVDRATGFYDRNLHRSGRGRRRHSSRKGGTVESSGSRQTRLKRQVLIGRLIAVAALVGVVILSMLLIHSEAELASAAADGGTLASELNRTQTELDQAKKLLAAQDVELGALIKQRIPGIQGLEIDKLFDVNRGHLKKLSFSESGVGADKRLTYYAVLKNTGSTPATPRAMIMLFDRKGLQTGLVRIQPQAATPQAESAELQPGETRTYSAPVEILRKDEPRYFLIETD